MKPDDDNKRLLSARAVHRISGIPPNLLKELAETGVLPPVIRTETRSYWARADIEKILAGKLADNKERANVNA